MKKALEKYLFPAVLLLWPLAACLQGVCVSDPTYSLGNYIHLFEMEKGSTWMFATYLANLLGSLIIRLPFGDSMAAMNIMTALLVSLSALTAYCTLRRFMPDWMAFAGLVLAENLFWCPTVILYNTLSTVFLTGTVCFLLLAVLESESGRTDGRRAGLWYLMAGICLGLNVFVRLSNAAHVLLILPVWYYAFLRGRKDPERNILKPFLTSTAFCVGGFVIGAAAGSVLVAVRYSLADYIAMIPGILGMGKEASSYTFSSMLLSTLDAYLTTLKFLLWVIPLMLCGLFLYRSPLAGFLKTGGEKERYTLHALIYTGAVLLLFRLWYGRGMFTLIYADYWCMFQWAMIFVIAAVLASLWVLLFLRDASPAERFLAFTAVILIAILPLGSNNYTFHVIGNLFVIAPAAVYFFIRLWKHYAEKADSFVVFGLLGMIMAALFLQSSLFHISFAFGDGTDGTKRSGVITAVPRAYGMHTVPDNKEALEGLYGWISENGLEEDSAIAVGNIPGIIYLCGLRPALSNLWPDLESYPEADFISELEEVYTQASPDDRPVIIMPTGYDLAEGAGTDTNDLSAGKRAALAACMEKYDYDIVYENDHYTVRKAGR